MNEEGKDDVHRGLQGITVDETRLSYIDGENGVLTIGGFPLEEIAPNASYEEVVFLLLNGHLPDREQLNVFRDELASRRSIPEETRTVVRGAARAGNSPMDALRMGSSTISLDRVKENPPSDALHAVAKFPTIVAAYWRYRNDQEPVEPDVNLSHAGNYLYMVTGERPSAEQTRGLETYLNSVVDHGLNASTFTARVILSTRSDVISAVTGATGALKGPLHGGAPGPVLDMIQEIKEGDDARSYLRKKLEKGERIMGFGHRVYNVRDPRAEVLSNAAEQFYTSGGDRAFFEHACEIERAAVEVLEEHKPDLDLETNVEYYTATLLHGIGIPKELFSPTFAVGRVGGWTAHCLEQLENNRLIRPRAKYTGERNRTYVPPADR